MHESSYMHVSSLSFRHSANRWAVYLMEFGISRLEIGQVLGCHLLMYPKSKNPCELRSILLVDQQMDPISGV